MWDEHLVDLINEEQLDIALNLPRVDALRLAIKILNSDIRGCVSSRKNRTGSLALKAGSWSSGS